MTGTMTETPSEILSETFSGTLAVEWLGLVPYGEALALQEAALRDRAAGRCGDRMLLLEHPPVITLGRSHKQGHVLFGEDRLRAMGVELYEVARGGDATYHGPGQLVGYPIIDLSRPERRDLHGFLRQLEGGLIDALEQWSIPARRIEGRTGVFIDRERSRKRGGRERKIASIGIGLRRWVTWHGFALNVDIDLAGFDAIVPCGLQDVVMTSVARELAIERGDVDAPGAPASGSATAAVDAKSISAIDPSARAQSDLAEPVRESVARSLTKRLGG